MRFVNLVAKVRLAVGEQALALFGAAGELRQGDEQLRGSVAGGILRWRDAEDHGQPEPRLTLRTWLTDLVPRATNEEFAQRLVPAPEKS